jgi:hypothetical protein
VKEVDEEIDRPLTEGEVKSEFVKASKDLDQATGVDVGERSRVLAEYGRPVSMG